MFTFPTALYPRPKDLKIATLNNKLCNINYSSHKSSNSITAKHTFTTIPACASLLLPCSPVPMTGFARSLQRQLSHKCYVPHVCARPASHRSCFHMLPPTPLNALATSLQVSYGKKKIKKIRRGQRLQSSNSLPSVPIKTRYTQPTRSQQPWQQSFKTCLNYVISRVQAVHLLRHI